MSTAPQTTDVQDRLFAGLSGRRTPQAVAADLVELGVDKHLDGVTAQLLRTLGSAGSYGYWGSSMRTTFRRHPGLERAYLAAARALDAVSSAASVAGPDAADPQDPADLTRWVAQAQALLGLDPDSYTTARHNPRPRQRTRTETYTWAGLTQTYSHVVPVKPAGRRGDTAGHLDPRTRYTAEQRRQHLPGVSVRAYRRAVAAVAHLEQRTAVLTLERAREAAVAYGKGRLASTIDRAGFDADLLTGAFVAYYTARLGMRTLFTAGAQDRPMDDIAEALLRAALASPSARPDVVARVLTRQAVLTLLTDAQRGELLAVTYQVMVDAATVLEATFDPKRSDMIVRQGDDSSSWNAASRAFNQARTGWLNLTRALGVDGVFTALPGKVPALIAADVAQWHRAEGGTTHQDEAVFRALPKPWDVVLHGVDCSADLIRTECRERGIDADATGWTAPYRQGALEKPVIAPDLVHGIAVSSPHLAAYLRAGGWFSGQA